MPKDPRERLKERPTASLRAGIARGASEVDREGGMFAGGLVHDVGIITRGEALGHELWIDSDFLSDVTAAINSSKAENGGVKARFTHPGLSADGLASRLGRVTNAKTVGDRVFADLHLLQSAHEAPDGDLAGYVMDLAEEDPDSFGVSIVFDHNFDAELQFAREHEDEDGRFVSPDPENDHSLYHARLRRMRSADVVDEPAANKDGLFYVGQDAAAEAEDLLNYALGLSETRPATAFLSVDPDRVSGFVSRFLDRHQLEVRKAGDPVTTEIAPKEFYEANRKELTQAEAQQPAGMSREEFSRQLKRYTDAFGAQRGVDWFNADVEFESAACVFAEMEAELNAAQEKIGELEARLASIETGDPDGATASDGTSYEEQRKRTLANRIRIAGKQNNGARN